MASSAKDDQEIPAISGEPTMVGTLFNPNNLLGIRLYCRPLVKGNATVFTNEEERVARQYW